MFEEKLGCDRVPLRPHSATNIVKEEFQSQIPLILDVYVVKDHTSSHDVNETFLVPKNEPDLEQWQT
jgi:hypothetical protein